MAPSSAAASAGTVPTSHASSAPSTTARPAGTAAAAGEDDLDPDDARRLDAELAAYDR